MNNKNLIFLISLVSMGIITGCEQQIEKVTVISKPNQVSLPSQEISNCPFLKSLQASAQGESKLSIGDPDGKWSGKLYYSQDKSVSGSCSGLSSADVQACVDFAASVCASEIPAS